MATERVVKRSVSKRVRNRRAVRQIVDFKTSSWYQKAALSISAAPMALRWPCDGPAPLARLEAEKNLQQPERLREQAGLREEARLGGTGRRAPMPGAAQVGQSSGALIRS